MQIVIDIPDEEYKRFVYIDILKLRGYIENGIPLPKGHGRLIDADKLKTHFIGTEQGTDLEVYLEPTIIDSPTIIEADKAESEE